MLQRTGNSSVKNRTKSFILCSLKVRRNGSGMKVGITGLLAFLLHAGLMGQAREQSITTVQVYDFARFEPFLHPANRDTVFLFNFWATYCAPCISELPHFDQAAKEFAGKPLKIVLVSLDFKSAIETRVVPFINKHGIRSRVVVLNDPDANNWIYKVSPAWSGAIPATLVVKGDKREFYEKAFTYDELKAVIHKFIKQ